MSPNHYQPHLLVLPEDDANRQIANGFELEVRHERRIRVLPEAGGWLHVLDNFCKNQIHSMAKFRTRHVLLLLDFDDQPDRRSWIEGKIPRDLKDRVFLLGVRSDPEALKRTLKAAGCRSFEEIGRRLAVECRDGLGELWQHDLLLENFAELGRLEMSVRPFLFGPV